MAPCSFAIDYRYIKGDMSSHTQENTIFLTIQQGQEPPNFSGHFMGWSEKASAGKSYAELEAAIAGAVSMSGFQCYGGAFQVQHYGQLHLGIVHWRHGSTN